jgi:hypothetical protein
VFKADPTTDPIEIKGHNYIWRKETVEGVAVLVPRLVTTNGGDGSAPGTRMFRDLDFKKLFRPQPAL